MESLKLIDLGGMGNVTQNMYLYTVGNEMVVVDCGIGFPDEGMPGVDIMIPDISYLRRELQRGKKLVGMILTHGHDDHIAALPYLSQYLPEELPIYASALTAEFATSRMKDGKVDRPIRVIEPKQTFALGSKFKATSFVVTHSVPDTRHFLLETPVGNFYHGTDFKLDSQPVDGIKSDLEGIGRLKEKKIRLMTVDCLRVEKKERVPSESTVGPAIDRLMAKTRGKFIVTLMSSHIHRIQQVVDCAERQERKVVFVGRSVEQNIKSALAVEKIYLPKGLVLNKKNIDQVPDDKLCLIIAGSQGQEGSSLTRAVFGEHRQIQISAHDTVVFSADAIPGNEIAYFKAIDELASNGVKVIYPDIEPGVHQSGHASRVEQKQLLELVSPDLVMPIGGADRHRQLFKQWVAKPLGYKDDQILLPKTGQVLEITANSVRVAEEIQVTPQLVDGLGVGDVGPAVLSDRKSLSQAGMIVVIIPQINNQLRADKIEVISRGFVFMKEAEAVIEFIKRTTAEVLDQNKKVKNSALMKLVEKRLSKKLYKVIQREPLIIPITFRV